MWRSYFILFALFNSSVNATELPVKLYGDWRQGSVVALSVEPEAKIWADKRALIVSRSGQTLLGIGRDATYVDMVMQIADQSWSWREPVVSRNYDIQRIDGLPNSKVSPDTKSLAEIKQNNADIADARLKQGLMDMPILPFQWPVLGRVSGVYGSQRILNGQARRPHFGVDIAAPEGTPILAPADGKVVLQNANMVLTGQTMMIDHGLGLKSIYVHMSAMRVKTGDMVTRGQQIGSVGKTGRATGPHLHWGVSWHDVQVDPASLTETPTP